MWTEPHDTFSSYIPGPGFGVGPYGPYAPQYEVDVTTERQTFINDVPMRLDSSTSTFSSFAPPPLSVPLPAYPGIECYGVEYLPQASALQTVNPAAIGPSPDQVFQGEVQVQIQDQHQVQVQDQDEGEQILVQDYLLLDHFFSMVLPQLFPVLEAHREGYFTEIVTEALESSWPYYWPYWHCCLSAAAVHRKTTEEVNQKQIDNDIMYHRCQTITQLNKAFKNPTNLKGILDTALAQIFLNCSVGHCPEGTSNDKPLTPRDVPWVGHFEAAKDIVERFELPPKAFEFNMKLISWIDILGSTMLGHSPHFAGTYREKLRYGIPSGLQELMGCDDRIMYLISEIACLESGKHNGLIDDSMAREFVAKLGEQLDHTQPANLTLQDHSLSIGPIPPASLTNIITHIFRNAARIYLRSLEPGFDRNDPSIKPLVKAVENAFQCIPMGPAGFDRSLVWPLFMTGVFSTPGSSFRKTLKARAEALGYQAKLGSFGRMMKLLTELWGSGGHSVNTPETSEDDSSSLTSPISKLEKPEFPTSAEITLGGREIKPRQVHWRDLMRQKGWHYLLI